MGKEQEGEETQSRRCNLMAEVARRRKAQLGLRGKKSGRSRAIYDIPEHLKLTIAVIAERENLSNSGAAALLLAVGARRYTTGELAFDGAKTPVDHNRYTWVIDEHTVLRVLHGEPLVDAADGPFEPSNIAFGSIPESSDLDND